LFRQAGIALVCDYSDIPAWLTPPGSCLAGAASTSDPNGDPYDVGPTGGALAGLLLGQFDQDGDGVAGSFDCDDDDDTIYPGAAEVCGDGIDSDCSGGDAADADLDGYEDDSSGTCPAVTAADCDDSDSSINPGATDYSCDGIDSDCSGGDEDDFDGDGYIGLACSGGDDCDDQQSLTFPGAAEICDAADNDCDGSLLADESDADGDGYLGCPGACPPGWGCGDCDDGEATVFPGATELCDGLDNDCDGSANLDAGGEVDDDGDGFRTCDGDCDENDASIFPGAPELCDGLDNDCDGSVDNDVVTQDWYPDNDGDGYGDSGAAAISSCSAVAGSVPNGDDCDDSDPAIYLGAEELCDSLDNNCDQAIDEGCGDDDDSATGDDDDSATGDDDDSATGDDDDSATGDDDDDDTPVGDDDSATGDDDSAAGDDDTTGDDDYTTGGDDDDDTPVGDDDQTTDQSSQPLGCAMSCSLGDSDRSGGQPGRVPAQLLLLLALALAPARRRRTP